MIALIGYFTFLLFLVSAQDTIGCYQNGECTDSSFISKTTTQHPIDCHYLCQSTNECAFFTFYGDSSECYIYANCIEFNDSSCSDCISGEVRCDLGYPDCFHKGKCTGSLVGYADKVFHQDLCLDLCFRNEDCKWWTFDDQDDVCFFMSGCPLIDQSHLESISGQKECGYYVFNTSSYEEINSLTGIIQSPRFPFNYPEITNNEWKITVPDTDAKVSLYFQDFYLEQSYSSCFYDGLEIYDGADNSSQLIAKVCGDEFIEGTFTTTGNEMFLRFYSDNTNEELGFQAIFYQNNTNNFI